MAKVLLDLWGGGKSTIARGLTQNYIDMDALIENVWACLLGFLR